MKEEIKIKNKDGLELQIITTKEDVEDYDPIIGGMSESLSWNEYIDEYDKELRPHIALIKRAIIKLGWVGKTGDQKANNTYFFFSDGIKTGFSWRAWGDLMQAIVNKREGYMEYYM